MTLTVHLTHEPDTDEFAVLRERLDDGISVTSGPEPAEGTEVLVSGVPTREQLDACGRLRRLVIPYAGLPVKTRGLLADFPGLAVHNLHHNAESTAETAIALLLAAAKWVVPLDRRLRDDDWSNRGRAYPSLRLFGRTALVLGYGAVGRHAARICRGLGMRVVATRRSATGPEEHGDVTVHPAAALHELLPDVHVVIVALPLTDATEGVIGAPELALLPEHAVLVNVGRGTIVDETALYEALAEGRLGGAGIDVWYSYPKSAEEMTDTSPSTHPFGELENVVLSPHRAGAFRDNEPARMTRLAHLLNALAAGDDSVNRVDVARGY